MKSLNDPVRKIIHLIGSVAVTASFSCQLAIAADITLERGVHGESDVIRVRGPLNLRDDVHLTLFLKVC